MKIVSNMNYDFELKIDDELIDGAIEIDGYKYQIWFEYGDISFEAKALSQGEGSLSFKQFSNDITYELTLELEEEGFYSGVFTETKKVSRKPNVILLNEEVQLKFV